MTEDVLTREMIAVHRETVALLKQTSVRTSALEALTLALIKSHPVPASFSQTAPLFWQYVFPAEQDEETLCLIHQLAERVQRACPVDLCLAPADS